MDKTQIFQDLESYRKDMAELDALRQMLEQITLVKSPVLFKEGSGKHISDPTLKAVNKIMAIEKQIEQKETKLIEKTERIARWTAECNSDGDGFLKKIIILHYLKGYDWGKVCLKVYGYHNYHTCRKMVMRYFGREK